MTDAKIFNEFFSFLISSTDVIHSRKMKMLGYNYYRHIASIIKSDSFNKTMMTNTQRENHSRIQVYNFDCSLKSVDNFCANITLPFTLSLPLAKSYKINKNLII